MTCQEAVVEEMLRAAAAGQWLTAAEIVRRTGFEKVWAKKQLYAMHARGLTEKRTRRVEGKRGRPEVEYALKPEHCGITQGREGTR